jgi:hypothetical protein
MEDKGQKNMAGSLCWLQGRHRPKISGLDSGTQRAKRFMSAKSQAQTDEKEEFREQGDLMDDESETGESVEDQKVG